MVNTIKSAAGLQLFVAFSTKLTEPAAVSALLGIYVAFKTVSEGTKVPDPEVVHCPLVAPPVIEPFNVIVALLAQTV
jgi:hypothetical protein